MKKVFQIRTLGVLTLALFLMIGFQNCGSELDYSLLDDETNSSLVGEDSSAEESSASQDGVVDQGGAKIVYKNSADLEMTHLPLDNERCKDWLLRNDIVPAAYRVRVTKILNGKTTYEYFDNKCLRDNQSGISCRVQNFDLYGGALSGRTSCSLASTGEFAEFQIGEIIE